MARNDAVEEQWPRQRFVVAVELARPQLIERDIEDRMTWDRPQDRVVDPAGLDIRREERDAVEQRLDRA